MMLYIILCNDFDRYQWTRATCTEILWKSSILSELHVVYKQEDLEIYKTGGQLILHDIVLYYRENQVQPSSNLYTMSVIIIIVFTVHKSIIIILNNSI